MHTRRTSDRPLASRRCALEALEPRRLLAAAAAATDAVEAAGAPAAVLRGTAGANEGNAYIVQLSATGAGAAISQWTIDWGDGTSNTPSASHVYPDGSAAHRIAATVTNDQGTWPVSVAVPDVAASLDTAFGLSGFATAHHEQPYYVRTPIVALPSGKTVVAGQSRSTETGRHWTIQQLTATGQDDPNFGFEGKLHLTFNDSTYGFTSSLLAQPDGKLIVAGGRATTSPQALRWTIVRLHPDGQQDDSFGTGGRILNPPGAPGAPSNIHALALQPDGRLLALGWINEHHVVARYLSNGTPDPSFGAGGVMDLTAATAGLANGLRTPSMIALQSDGRIIVGGWGNPNNKGALVAVRLTAAGALDTSFGTAGFVVAEFSNSATTATGMGVDAQDRVLLVGPGQLRDDDPYTYWGVARFSRDGVPDTRFGTGGGQFVTDFPANPQADVDLLMNADSSFWLGGSAGERKLAVVRVTAYGTYDAAFDNDGVWIPGRGGNVQRLAIQPTDGALLATTADIFASNPNHVMRFRWGGGVGVTVNNVQPTVTMGAARWISVGDTFQPALAATDPGQDTISQWLVEWGDGTSDTFAGGNDIASAQHVYATSGPRGVKITVTDEDGSYVRTLPVVVLDNPPVQNGVLRLPGTSGANFFQINAAPGFSNVGRFTLGNATFDYPLDGVSRILIDGAGGNDQVQVGGAITPGITFAPSSGAYGVMHFAPLTLDAASTPDGANVSITVNGPLRIDGSVRLDQLYVSYGSVDVTTGRGTVLRVNRFDYYGGMPSSYFDLHDNDMIIDYAPGQASPLGTRQFGSYSYGSVLNLLQRGHHGGAWNGNGMRSSAAGDSGLYALGAGEASHVLGLEGAATASWSGQAVDATSVLIKYTYTGDANLDGIVSGDDYAAIDFNIAVPNAFGWSNGDFNYDGIISGDDYAAIDFSIVAQGDPL